MSRSTDQSDEDKDAWLDDFVEKMSKPGPREETFFKERQKQRLGVGLDPAGSLVRASGASSKL